jgi:hypothetical protein
MMKSLIYILLFSTLSITISAQTEGRNSLEAAQRLFSAGKYEAVLNILKNDNSSFSQTDESLFLRALTYYQLNDLNQSELILKSLIKNEIASFAEVWLYLGRIAHHKSEFDIATNFYKSYLKNIAQNHPNRKIIWEEIRRCANGRLEQFNESSTFVENLGKRVNTPFDEFAPVESPVNESMLYFSAYRSENTGGRRNQDGLKDEMAGRLYSDMYRTSNEKGVWVDPASMHFVLNSPLHEILLNFNKDGDAVYFYRGASLEGGNILKNSFSQGGLVPQEGVDIGIDLPVDPDNGGIFLFRENMIFFSAKLPGGYGGWDIYVTTKSGNKWSKPQNLGPQINTAFDEVTPYLIPDGSELFYSSNNSEFSIGGFDILKSRYNLEEQTWTKPVSIGIPINSPGDDTHFRMAKDGFTGYFASSRKESLGLRDIYVAYFTESIDMSGEKHPFSTSLPEEIAVIKKQESRQEVKEVSMEEIKSPLPTKADIQPDFSEPKSNIQFASNQFNPSVEEIRWIDEYIKMLKNQAAGKLVIHLNVRPKTPLYDRFKEIEKYADDLASLMKGKGLKDEQLLFRIFTNKDIPENKVELSITIVDKDGFPLNQYSRNSVDPFSFDQKELNPFHYKIALKGASDLKVAALINNHMYPMIEKAGISTEPVYAIGRFKSYDETRQYAERLIKNGIKEVFINPYIYDTSVSLLMVKEFVHLFPDFKYFIEQQP